MAPADRATITDALLGPEQLGTPYPPHRSEILRVGDTGVAPLYLTPEAETEGLPV